MALAKSSDEKGPRSFDSTLVKKASRSSFVAALEADDDDEPAARDDEEDGGMACPVPDLFRRLVGWLVCWFVGSLVRWFVGSFLSSSLSCSSGGGVASVPNAADPVFVSHLGFRFGSINVCDGTDPEFGMMRTRY